MGNSTNSAGNQSAIGNTNRNGISPHIGMFTQNSRKIYSGLDIGESVPSAKILKGIEGVVKFLYGTADNRFFVVIQETFHIVVDFFCFVFCVKTKNEEVLCLLNDKYKACGMAINIKKKLLFCLYFYKE